MANIIFRFVVWLLSLALLGLLAITFLATLAPVILIGGLLFLGLRGIL